MLLGDRLDGWQVTGVPENVYRQDRHNPPSSMAGLQITPPDPSNSPQKRAKVAPPQLPVALFPIPPPQLSRRPPPRGSPLRRGLPLGGGKDRGAPKIPPGKPPHTPPPSRAVVQPPRRDLAIVP